MFISPSSKAIGLSETAFDFNVMGTMKVLSACAEAGVKRVISAAAARCCMARSRATPPFLREDHPLNAKRNFGTLRDLLEIETFSQSFRGQWPQVKLTLLRFAHILGPTVDSPLDALLA